MPGARGMGFISAFSEAFSGPRLPGVGDPPNRAENSSSFGLRVEMPLRLLCLMAIVCVAAWLRFSGLGWGQRHPIHTDERVYVDNVVAMLDAGDLDHRFYTYPGLFYYLLRLGLSPLDSESLHGPDAYVLARALVAFCGLLNVVLLAWVGTRLFGVAAGLVAALLAAVSPIDVDTTHQVRPDVLLQMAGLAAVVLLSRLGERLRGDAAAGVLIGIASAIKFTGVLLVPSYIAARLLARGRSWRALFLAGGLTLLIVLACTPYAVLHFSEYRHGPGAQLRLYDVGGVPWRVVLENVTFFLQAHVQALGSLGVAAVIAGMVASRRDFRMWAPLWLFPVTNVVVMSFSNQVFARWILPGIDILYLTAALGLTAVLKGGASWRIPAAVVLALGAAAMPAQHSLQLAREYRVESPQDRAQDWIIAHFDRGARILETRPAASPGATPGAMVGLPADRFEVRYPAPDDDAYLLPMLQRHMDLVFMEPGQGWRELATAFSAHDGYGQPQLLLKRPRQKLAYVEVPLRKTSVTASTPVDLSVLADGNLATTWSTHEPLRGGEWLEARFDRETPVARIELIVPDGLTTHDPEVAIFTSTDGHDFELVPSIRARAPIREQEPALGPRGQEILLKPRPIRAIRVEQSGRRSFVWRVAEWRLYVRRSMS